MADRTELVEMCQPVTWAAPRDVEEDDVSGHSATRDEVPILPSSLPWYRDLELTWKRRILGPLRRKFRSAPDRQIPPVNGYEILEKVAALPISTWSYEFEPGVRHLGPMSQDFAAAFGLGYTDRMISLLDSNGVALVAIQALHRKVVALEAEVAVLRGTRRAGGSRTRAGGGPEGEEDVAGHPTDRETSSGG